MGGYSRSTAICYESDFLQVLTQAIHQPGAMQSSHMSTRDRILQTTQNNTPIDSKQYRHIADIEQYKHINNTKQYIQHNGRGESRQLKIRQCTFVAIAKQQTKNEIKIFPGKMKNWLPSPNGASLCFIGSGEFVLGQNKHNYRNSGI